MNSKTPSIVDFNQAREQKLAEKRRKNERVFFKQLLSVYSVVEQGKIVPIELIDVSEEGCSFQVPFSAEDPWPSSTATPIPLRLYFSQDTYLEILVTIQNSRPFIDERGRFTRYGCSVDQQTSAFPAYQQFVKFLKLYSEAAHKDMGNVTVFYV